MEFENLKEELLAAIDSGLKYATNADSSADFEIYLYYSNRTRVGITQGVVDATDGIVEGNAVRVAKQKTVSFASSSGISTDRIQRSINEALASLRSISIRDDRFKGFCEPKKPGREGILTKEILSVRKEDLAGFASSMVKEAKDFDKRIQTAESECSAEWTGFAVGNTLGIQQASRSTIHSCEVACIAVKNEERRTSYEFDVTREKVIDPAGLGAKAAERAISLLGARKLNKTAVLPTLWEPIAAAAFIQASIGQSAMENYVVEGMSPLANKAGEEIASSKLTILDNGQNPSGVNTEAIDGEGYPQQNNIIIEQGRLKQFLSDTYYARIQGKRSSGNCARHTRPFGSTIPYESSPTIRPKNLEIKPGSKDLDDLISSISGQAILIENIPIGIFHSSVSTGEFSAVAQSAMLVENGGKLPIQPVSVSGNFYKGLKNTLEIGSDLRTILAVETPTLVFDGFSIVG